MRLYTQVRAFSSKEGVNVIAFCRNHYFTRNTGKGTVEEYVRECVAEIMKEITEEYRPHAAYDAETWLIAAYNLALPRGEYRYAVYMPDN